MRINKSDMKYRFDLSEQEIAAFQRAVDKVSSLT